MANYRIKLRIGINIKRKEKVKKAMEFVKKIKEKAEVALKKA